MMLLRTFFFRVQKQRERTLVGFMRRPSTLLGVKEALSLLKRIPACAAAFFWRVGAFRSAAEIPLCGKPRRKGIGSSFVPHPAQRGRGGWKTGATKIASGAKAPTLTGAKWRG